MRTGSSEEDHDEDTPTGSPDDHGEKGDNTTTGGTDTTAAPLMIRTSCVRQGSTSTCQACADVCPMDAISFEEDDAFPEGIPTIDSDLCLACDLCCAACPAEAVAPRNLSYSDVRFDIDRTSRYFSTAYVACSESNAKGYSGAVVEVPCLGCLPPELWFSCLCHGSSVAAFLPDGKCDACPCRTGEQMMEDAIAQAEAWSGAQVGLATEKSQMDFWVRTDDDGDFDRRAFFEDLGKRLTNSTRKMRESDVAERMRYSGKRLKERLLFGDGTKSERDERFEEARETGVFRKNGKNMMGRRRMVIDALLDDPDAVATTFLRCSTTDPFRCIGCRKCLAACPWGARTFHDGTVLVDPLYCTGCAKCSSVCEQDAIGFSDVPASSVELPRRQES